MMTEIDWDRVRREHQQDSEWHRLNQNSQAYYRHLHPRRPPNDWQEAKADAWERNQASIEQAHEHNRQLEELVAGQPQDTGGHKR